MRASENNIWLCVRVDVLHLLYHLFMAAISLLCAHQNYFFLIYLLLLSPPPSLRSGSPSPRPLCPPLSSSPVALSLSFLTSSLRLIVSRPLLCSNLSTPCFIKTSPFSLILPSNSQKNPCMLLSLSCCLVVKVANAGCQGNILYVPVQNCVCLCVCVCY